MSDYNLTGDSTAVALNESNTVGVFAYKNINNNQTRSALFTPEYLLEWAKAVNDAYGDDPAIEVVFTPDKPMVATKKTDKQTQVGIGIAPRLKPDDYDDLVDGDSE